MNKPTNLHEASSNATYIMIMWKNALSLNLSSRCYDLNMVT